MIMKIKIGTPKHCILFLQKARGVITPKRNSQDSLNLEVNT